MFENIAFHATLPAADLARAKQWYAEKLGLTPVEDNEGASWFETGGVRFLLYESSFAGSNQATAASLAAADFDAAIAELREAGVEFEEYDLGEIKTVDGVMTTPDGVRVAWFKDSEGNILSIAAS
ncbi:MAG: VOC family protein [Acidimicrobiia bacterium]|nr:VOC family protein [Acidimicrobiia bacterium]